MDAGLIATSPPADEYVPAEMTADLILSARFDLRRRALFA
jgi:hypothetical protein